MPITIIATSEQAYGRALRVAALRDRAGQLHLEAEAEPDPEAKADLLEEALHATAAALDIASEVLPPCRR